MKMYGFINKEYEPLAPFIKVLLMLKEKIQLELKRYFIFIGIAYKILRIKKNF